jgi:hypothetical protein
MERIADASTYLDDLCALLSTEWPNNRTVNIVCHGHSVPAGYFSPPLVDTFNSYPHLLHVTLRKRLMGPHLRTVLPILSAIFSRNNAPVPISGAP